MGKFRPPEFWEKYDANILMLDLVRRKLSLEDRILEASSSFIKTTKRGELLAIEFLPHLAKFCQVSKRHAAFHFQYLMLVWSSRRTN
jgi:hypothetical protein